jgi:hypothetical protein
VRRAERICIDVTDQAQRYQAWAKALDLDPVALSDPRLRPPTPRARDQDFADAWTAAVRAAPTTAADASIVFVHTDESILVRCDWLFLHGRRRGEVSHPAELARRMELAGWTRRGKRGRIKATSPGMGKPIVLPFWIVPPGWEDQW